MSRVKKEPAHVGWYALNGRATLGSPHLRGSDQTEPIGQEGNRHMLLSVQLTLVQLEGTKVFLKNAPCRVCEEEKDHDMFVRSELIMDFALHGVIQTASLIPVMQRSRRLNAAKEKLRMY